MVYLEILQAPRVTVGRKTA